MILFPALTRLNCACARAIGLLFKANEPKDADIIWTSVQVDEDMKAATGITENQFVNQFPFEACIVMKHHLAETIQKVESSHSVVLVFYSSIIDIIDKFGSALLSIF